jgi:exosortase
LLQDQAMMGRLPRLSAQHVALAAAGALYAPVLVALVRTWGTDPAWSHGFAVVAVSAWLVWRGRAAIGAARGGPGRFSLALLALGLGIYALAMWAEIDFVQPVSLLVSLTALAAHYLGWGSVRRMWFPLAFLIFAIPWPDALVDVVSFPMQLLSTTYASIILGVLGIPVKRAGVQLATGNYVFEVGAPCSGMRSLAALLALAAIMAHMWPGSPMRRVALFLAGAPIALAANAMRIACILLIAANWGSRAAEGFFHGLSGILVFMLAAAGLLAAGAALGLGQRQRVPAQTARA